MQTSSSWTHLQRRPALQYLHLMQIYRPRLLDSTRNLLLYIENESDSFCSSLLIDYRLSNASNCSRLAGKLNYIDIKIFQKFRQLTFKQKNQQGYTTKCTYLISHTSNNPSFVQHFVLRFKTAEINFCQLFYIYSKKSKSIKWVILSVLESRDDEQEEKKLLEEERDDFDSINDINSIYFGIMNNKIKYS